MLPLEFNATAVAAARYVPEGGFLYVVESKFPPLPGEYVRVVE